ncbi:Uncharacterized protein APZ42_026649 [Daphnia magna]|uniref:Uncharacterized protein n=1 Tax=Daphnia magna TaxID=35525 RepID=A0A164S1J4_9CRUS|nr:Uncharacterized protein APZ42_026649 [Daphnia magna]
MFLSVATETKSMGEENSVQVLTEKVGDIGFMTDVGVPNENGCGLADVKEQHECQNERLEYCKFFDKNFTSHLKPSFSFLLQFMITTINNQKLSRGSKALPIAPLRRVHPLIDIFIQQGFYYFSMIPGLYLLIELITKYEYHRWKGHEINHDLRVWELFLLYGVCEVHKFMTRDAVESKIKNWLRHCPMYALKNHEDEKINGENKLRQVDSD